MKNSDVALGILAGLAVGTVIGILFAPAKGSETRKKIADNGSDLKNLITDSSSQLGEKISQTMDTLKAETQNILGVLAQNNTEEKPNFDHLVEINRVK
jgi:gas vesicle protein